MNFDELPIKKSFINPLWIITVFFLFAETIAGIGITQTSNAIQLMLTIFVVAFPSLVSLIFFIILWYRPKHLYAPKDYQTDQSFLQSFNNIPNIGETNSKIQEIILTTLNSESIISKLQGQAHQKVLSDAADEIIGRVNKESFIAVDLDGFSDNLVNLELPYESFKVFSDLTYIVGSKLSKVRPHSYGYDWAFKNIQTNEILQNTRMLIGAPPGEPIMDLRTLKAMNILPGTTLVVIKP